MNPAFLQVWLIANFVNWRANVGEKLPQTKIDKFEVRILFRGEFHAESFGTAGSVENPHSHGKKCD